MNCRVLSVPNSAATGTRMASLVWDSRNLVIASGHRRCQPSSKTQHQSSRTMSLLPISKLEFQGIINLAPSTLQLVRHFFGIVSCSKPLLKTSFRLQNTLHGQIHPNNLSTVRMCLLVLSFYLFMEMLTRKFPRSSSPYLHRGQQLRRSLAIRS